MLVVANEDENQKLINLSWIKASLAMAPKSSEDISISVKYKRGINARHLS